MMFHPTSLQQRFTVFLILPVMLLLACFGFAGFFYVGNMLVDQWREASILKLQRAAHEMDMHLARIKDGIRLVQEATESDHSDAYRHFAFEHLSRHQGVQNVTLTTEASRPEGDHSGGPQPEHSEGGHSDKPGVIREITPPVFEGEHGSFKLIAGLSNDLGQFLAELEVTVNFDYIFRNVVESGWWWQSSKAFLVDRSGNVLVCTVPGRQAALTETNDPLESATYWMMQSSTSGTLLGEGHPPKEVSGFFHLHEAPWVLIMIAPGDEILAPIIRFEWAFGLLAFAVIVVIVALIRNVTTRTVAKIRRVSDEALRLSKGEFGEPLPVLGRDEVSELTQSFNRMTRQLKERLELKHDLGLAMEIQQSLLPSGPPDIPGLDIAGRSVYCQQTGGDYFDYIESADLHGQRRLCVAVGDVVGHGVSAALLMTTVRALLRSRLDRPGGMAEKVCDINRLLCNDTADSGSFVTIFLLEVDPVSGQLEWVRAGHDAALLYHAKADQWEKLSGSGMAIGIQEGYIYKADNKAALGLGDIVLIGTDGVWETQNSKGKFFSRRKVRNIVKRHREETAERILQEVLGALGRFRGRADQEDDVTLVVIKAKAD